MVEPTEDRRGVEAEQPGRGQRGSRRDLAGESEGLAGGSEDLAGESEFRSGKSVTWKAQSE